MLALFLANYWARLTKSIYNNRSSALKLQTKHKSQGNLHPQIPNVTVLDLNYTSSAPFNCKLVYGDKFFPRVHTITVSNRHKPIHIGVVEVIGPLGWIITHEIWLQRELRTQHTIFIRICTIINFNVIVVYFSFKEHKAYTFFFQLFYRIQL